MGIKWHVIISYYIQHNKKAREATNLKKEEERYHSDIKYRWSGWRKGCLILNRVWEVYVGISINDEYHENRLFEFMDLKHSREILIVKHWVVTLKKQYIQRIPSDRDCSSSVSFSQRKGQNHISKRRVFMCWAEEITTNK